MNERQQAVVLFARLGAVVLGGLLVLAAGIAKSGVVALIGGVLTVLSSLVMMESFTHRREGQAVLPALIGATVSAVGAAAGLIGHWTDVSVVLGRVRRVAGAGCVELAEVPEADAGRDRRGDPSAVRLPVEGRLSR